MVTGIPSVDTERIIELEHEVIETRRAAVSIIHDVIRLCDGIDRIALAQELDMRATHAAVAESRLARLVAETLRRT